MSWNKNKSQLIEINAKLEEALAFVKDTKLLNDILEIQKVLAYEITARNVVNQEAINNFIDMLIREKDLQEAEAPIIKFLKSNLRNFLINNQPAQELTPEAAKEEFAPKETPEWVNKAIERGDKLYAVELSSTFERAMLETIDYMVNHPEDNFYKMAIPDLVKKSMDWHEDLQKEKDEELAEGKTEIALDFKDGFTVKSLLNEKALKREGNLMGHCVGGENYCRMVRHNAGKIYSLRDASNQPHATMEVKDKEVKQLRGKGNKPIVEKYIGYVVDFLSKEQLQLTPSDLKDNLLIYSKGSTYSIYNLPKGLIIDELNLSDTEIIGLPEGINVKGTLNLSKTPITELPAKLKAKNINLSDCTKISKLPKGLKTGILDLSGSAIVELPSDIKVESLNLSETKIKKLPDNLKLEGYLNIQDTLITKLPKGLNVGGFLSLNDNIKSLPDDLKAGKIYVPKSPLKKFPKRLKENLHVY